MFLLPCIAPVTSAIALESVSKHYGPKQIIHDVSFTVEPGEIVGFLGPNGAGKTTTLKMLAGLLQPSAGRASVGGLEPFRRSEAFLASITLVLGQKQQLVWDLPPQCLPASSLPDCGFMPRAPRQGGGGGVRGKGGGGGGGGGAWKRFAK